MKKALAILSAVLVIAVMAVSAFAEFETTDFVIPESGVHFAFDGNANDEFGALTGELVGDPTFVAGRDGTENGAIYFDDDTQYVGLYKYVPLCDYTASFWVYLEENGAYNFLCTSILGSYRAMQNSTQVVGNTINGVVDNSTGYTVPVETWTMLTFVYDDTAKAATLYVNGEVTEEVLSGELPLPLTTIGNEAAEQKGWQTYPFQTLDDVWFFGRALTAEEVKTLYETNAVAAAAPTYTYPASGESGNLIAGAFIGADAGWDGTEASGKASAFDGNPATFYDPAEMGRADCYVGVDAGESYILDKVAVLSRENWNDRFMGASIQGSDDMENWTTLWQSAETGTNPAYYVITEFENNTGYRYFRYFNDVSHGDVAEVEFYGNAGKVEVVEEVVEEEPVEEVVEEVVEEAVEEAPVETVEEAPAEEVVETVVAEAPQTFDAAIIAAVAAVISLAGYSVSKKH